MTHRLGLLSVLVSVFFLSATVFAASPVPFLPHQHAPYYHGGNDGPISMATAPDGSLWAVWSYTHGAETDIAVSKAIGNTWTAPVLLGADNGRTDLDPRIAFTRLGTPVVTWWMKSTLDVHAMVMLSFLQHGSWSHAYPHSDPSQDARHPAFITGNEALSLAFELTNPITGDSSISIAPVREPEPTGGTNGPDPIPTIGLPVGDIPGTIPEGTIEQKR